MTRPPLSARNLLLACAVLGGAWACSAGAASRLQADQEGAGGGPPPSTPPVMFDAGETMGPDEDVVVCRATDPDEDADGDGFTPNQGDCDDCDPNVNPGAVEVVADDGNLPKDEDCDGEADETEHVTCDADLALDDEDPMNAARAIDLCKQAVGDDDWGILRAKWVLADGSPAPTSDPKFHLGHARFDNFGANVDNRGGERMLALSSGTARRPEDPGFESPSGFDKDYEGLHPAGFPKEAPACPGVTTGKPNDPIALQIELRVPTNATGFSFDFNFFTYEWPDFVCSEFNDFFVALLSPTPEGQTDGNISFDSQGNPVGVNSAFVEVCGCPGNPPGPCMAGGKTFMCPKGNLGLVGTGFGADSAGSFGSDHASTGWLRTSAPAEPGSIITLRLAVYDSGDHALDTTTLIDNFQWLAEPGIKVVTEPPVK